MVISSGRLGCLVRFKGERDVGDDARMMAVAPDLVESARGALEDLTRLALPRVL